MSILIRYEDSTYDFTISREQRVTLDVFETPPKTFINIIPF